jgi:hypothetical protein
MVRRCLGDDVFCVVCKAKFRRVSLDAVCICDSCWAKRCMVSNGWRCSNCFLMLADSKMS